MAWYYGRKVNALWADWGSKNSWILTDIGPNNSNQWVRLRQDNFDAVTYMTILAAEAKSDGRYVDFEEDGTGMISQIYVW